MQKMEQEMLLMVLGEMTVAVSVVLSQSLGQAGGNRHSWSPASVRDLSKIILFPHKERLNGNINMSDVQVNILVIYIMIL